MKKRFFLLCCIGISLVGCNHKDTKEIPTETIQVEHIEEKRFTVEERQSEGYKSLKEVVKSDEVDTVIKIIKNAEWQENVKAEMAGAPDYRFRLGSFNYDIWVTPNRDRLEIIPQGQAKYIKLPIKDSEILYTIITGKEL